MGVLLGRPGNDDVSAAAECVHVAALLSWGGLGVARTVLSPPTHGFLSPAILRLAFLGALARLVCSGEKNSTKAAKARH